MNGTPHPTFANAGLPDILMVQHDRQDEAKRVSGGHIGADALSVYLEGGPRYRLNDRTYHFSPPIALLIPRGTYDGDLQAGRIHGLCLLFHGHGLVRPALKRDDQVMVALGRTKLALPMLKPIGAADAERLASFLQEIRDCQGGGCVAQAQRLGLLFRAIAEYAEIEARSGHTAVHREALRLRTLIETQALENLRLEQVYNKLDLSAAHAETLFKTAFGVTPVAYRFHLRMKKARELLVSSQMNVRQTAQTVGFADALYFSRVFHRTFGIQPSQLIRDFSNRRTK